MKNALINPNESPIKYISGWTDDPTPEPIFVQIENSCRICEVLNETFDVCLPLFWIECNDDVLADQYYYNLTDKEIYPIPRN